MTAFLQSGAFWLLLVGLGVATYVLRASFVLFVERVDELPAAADDVLTYVPLAVLAALIAPDVLVPGGTLSIAADLPKLTGGFAGVVVAWWRENMLATVAVGMAVFWAVRYLG